MGIDLILELVVVVLVVAACGSGGGWALGSSSLLEGWRDGIRGRERVAWTLWAGLDEWRPSAGDPPHRFVRDDDEWTLRIVEGGRFSFGRSGQLLAVAQWRLLRLRWLAEAKLIQGACCSICAGWWCCGAAAVWLAAAGATLPGWAWWPAVTLAACWLHTVMVVRLDR